MSVSQNGEMNGRGTRRGWIIAIVVAFLILAPIGWYLGSPLLLSTTVDEDFPFEIPSAEAIAELSDEELREMAAQLQAAIPSEVEIDAMPEEEKEALEAKVMEAAAVVMPMTEVDEPMPDQPTVTTQGNFVDADSFHRGSGIASIYSLPDGGNVLRLENFEVTNGPDLHVILATNPNPTSRDDLGEYVDLGSLKGNMGNQNYEIPADVDVSQYQSVVVYCMPFHVVFSTATLN